MREHHPELTAIHRKTPSLPVRLALKECLVKSVILDYGCGTGRDVRFLRYKGYKTTGWDPFYSAQKILSHEKYLSIFCTYVLNVVFRTNRLTILKDIRYLLASSGTAIISVRSAKEIEEKAMMQKWRRYKDGWLTKRNTFQKGFTSTELAILLRKNGFPNIITLRENPVILVASRRSLRHNGES